MIDTIKGGLIVSCQALDDEPLHSSFIMSRMAVAAKMGGAKGIRANSIEDIRAIKKEVELPIIGIVKKDFPDSEVYITCTMHDIDELHKAGCDIIAMDATGRKRTGNVSLPNFYHTIRKKYPTQKLMADCSTISEAIVADKLGFDFIGTTLIGYTPESKHDHVDANDFSIIKKILAKVKHPVIAEGNIDTPRKAKRVIELGCYSVVVGSIITRPQIITKRFTDEISRGK